MRTRVVDQENQKFFIMLLLTLAVALLVLSAVAGEVKPGEKSFPAINKLPQKCNAQAAPLSP